MAAVTKDELDAALSQMKETIMEDVHRELEQRVKTEDFQSVLESDKEDLKAKMVELETKLSMSADQVRELQAKLQKETPVRTYPMETPKKESAGEPEDDVDMDDEVIKYSREELKALRGIDLKGICRARKLKTSGNKAELEDRLWEAQGVADEEQDEDNKYSAEGLKFLTVVQLKEMCRDEGLTMTGNKAAIIDRLVKANATEKTQPESGKGVDLLPDSWAGKQLGGGGGKGGANRVDSEKDKNIYERKLFDKRVPKLSGEKGEKGEKEFKKWFFRRAEGH